MKSTVFIFHGTEGYPEENWFPWLTAELEKRGCQVFVPQFPSPPGKAASVEEWFAVLDDYRQYIDGETALIGHSLGGVFALRVLEKIPQPVKAVLLVGTPVGVQPILNYERDSDFSGFEFDWKTIVSRAKQFAVYHSDNDPYVGQSNGEALAHHLGIELNLIPNAGHFNTKAGYTAFPELLKKLETIA